MPSNPIDEFLQGLDPIDAATLFAGVRNTVPLGMLFRSGSLNEGHDEQLARRQAPRVPTPAPVPSAEELDRRAIAQFEAQYPNPVLRQLVIEHMLQGRANPYDPSTATRRRDFEEAPETSRKSMRAAPKRFNKGGSAKKTLDEMAAEMARKGVKVADKPDLGRRSLFGLGPKSAFPLANIDTKALEKMQRELKGAPAITEKTVTVDPGKGAAKSTVKSIAETPVSRREILQSMAGQAMRGVLPDMGGLGALGKVTQAAESVAGPAAPSALTNPYAIIMSMLKQGKSEEDIIKMFAKKMPSYNEYAVEDMISNVRNPSGYLHGELPTLKTPSGALREIVEFKADARDDHLNPLKLRPELRQLRSADPGAYKEMINAAKDISMLSAEEAANIGLKPQWIEKFMRGEIDYLDLPKGYQRKIDNINAGFGNED